MHRTFSTVCVVLMMCAQAMACAPLKAEPPKVDKLAVKVLYPNPASAIEMGQPLKCIVEVRDEQGELVDGAHVEVSIKDASGEVQVSIPAMEGSGSIYRTAAWLIPHKTQAGEWTIGADVETEAARYSASTSFRVENSLSEELLGKYGFWVEAPSLRGIVPTLVKEQGDADNGVIIWGGIVPLQHIFAESWLEVQWRKGNFQLTNAGEVRKFMLDTLGDIGFSPLRALGPFDKAKFEGWDAWQVKARGQYTRYDWQWMVFYAPEADKTYAIGTTVVLAPEGIDPHVKLRGGFEVHPELHANGSAPEPLPRLLPASELTGPELGTRASGTRQSIVLKWKPVKELAQDEFYRVAVDYNYGETNYLAEYKTRETDFVLPASLYNEPNCGVFNWQVTLMRSPAGGSTAEALSYRSLYWYVEWLHPPGEPPPFEPRCPNPQT